MLANCLLTKVENFCRQAQLCDLHFGNHIYNRRSVMKKVVMGVIGAAAIAGLSGNALATLLTADMTVDNAFNLNVSTDDTVAGTLVGSGNNWGAVYTIANIPLTPGVTNYIHVAAADFGAPA